MAAKAATKSAMYQELSTATGLTRKQVGSVFLQVMTPLGASVRFFKQVSPEVVDLTDKVTWRQPAGLDHDWRTVTAIDPGRPLVSAYPTGSWSGGEDREYHVCLQVTPQEIGEDHEVRAGRVAVVVEGQNVARAPIRASWTDDADQTTRIDHAVAHYTGQEELAISIEEGRKFWAFQRQTIFKSLTLAALIWSSGEYLVVPASPP